MKKLLDATLCALFLSACSGGAGIAPPTDRLFFPVSVAADAGGQRLYVANGNFNTAFDGGTIVALDLAQIETDGLACRDAQVNGTTPPDGCQALAPTPPTLCVTNGSGRCSTTDFSLKYIDKDATVVTASFAGEFIQLPGQNRVFFAVSGDQSLSFFDFDPTQSGAAAIDCAAETITLDPVPATGGATRRVCGGDHVLLSDRSASKDERGIVIPGFADGAFTATIDLNRDIPQIGATDLLYVSHLDNGFLSVFRLTPSGEPLFQRSEFLNIGVNDMAVHPPSGLLYVLRRTVFVDGSSITGNSVELVQPRVSDDDPSQIELFSKGSLRIDQLDSGALDYRSIAFSEDGSRLYIGAASPSAVLVLDTSPNQFGEPKNQLLARISVEKIPEQMKLINLGGREFLYITDLTNDRVHMIDTDLIESGGARVSIDVGEGPFGITNVTLPGNKQRLVVTNFDDDTLSVIDADPSSPTRNQVLYRVGAPRPAETN